MNSLLHCFVTYFIKHCKSIYSKIEIYTCLNSTFIMDTFSDISSKKPKLLQDASTEVGKPASFNVLVVRTTGV